MPPTELPALMSWVGIICYTLQIYFDFSGYSDMAIGLAKMFGFNFKENFNHPYISTSIQDFWRRWHISLSTWFRDYLYISLGGNQKGVARTYVNLLIVFFITGLWHGASWNFIIWGMFHGLFLVLERAKIIKLEKFPEVLKHVYVILIVMIGWVFFRAEDPKHAMIYLKSLIGLVPGGNYSPVFLINYYTLVVFFLGILLTTPFRAWLNNYFTTKGSMSQSTKLIGVTTLYVTLFVWCIIELAQASYNPFIYFRF